MCVVITSIIAIINIIAIASLLSASLSPYSHLWDHHHWGHLIHFFIIVLTNSKGFFIQDSYELCIQLFAEQSFLKMYISI